MAQSLVEQAIAAGLEPRTHPNNASGYAGVHPLKNDKYQGRYWDSISKKQRAVPGLFDQPRDAALALAFAKLLAADAQAKGEKHTSPQKRKSRREREQGKAALWTLTPNRGNLGGKPTGICPDAGDPHHQ